MDDKIDFKQLAAEAAAEAYSPRAKVCWPWSHEWTMWEYENSLKMYQNRRCLRCGLIRQKRAFTLG